MRYRVADSEAGLRVDRVVAAHSALSRKDVRALFDEGAVRLNGRRVKRGERVDSGDELQLEEAAALSTEALADPEVDVNLAYEDPDFLVVDKPAGLPTHPLRAGERGCLANGLVHRFPELAGIGYEPRQPGLVNRLDNDTSGLLLVARTAAAFHGLREMLAGGGVRKRYVAATDVLPDRTALRWALAPDPSDSRRITWAGEKPELDLDLQRASSDVVRMATGPTGTFITVQARRARRHQVRCHLAAAGAPICGDTLYGGRPLAVGHQLLHACELLFLHPHRGVRVEVSSSMPEVWREWIRTEGTAPPGP